jgi:hypothetical protein
MKNRNRRAQMLRALLGLMLTTPVAAPAWALTPPPVPTDIAVDPGYRLQAAGHAVGTQQYVCTTNPTGPTGPPLGWVLYGPQATLYSDHHSQVMTHFLSPNPEEGGMPRATWQHSRDSSRVWAKAIATSIDAAYVAPDAIPWLKLQFVGVATGPRGGRRLAGVSIVQRVNTVGGKAPATGCAEETDIGKKSLVPYEADYFFYRAPSNATVK